MISGYFKRPRRSLVERGADQAKGDDSIVPTFSDGDTGYSVDSLQTSPIAFEDGIKIWHDCDDANVDICFVHGLSGDRDSTWTHPQETRPWPQLFLPPRIEKARILTYGYDAYVLRPSLASSDRLIDHAANLVMDLTQDRDECNASQRPLLLVAHSMGGIVCKRAILLSRDSPESHHRSLFNSTKGIIFLGTPHRGAWMADWATIPASAFGLVPTANKSILKVLETESQLLEDLQINFSTMLRKMREENRSIEVTCFCEELPFPDVGQIVSRDSATLDEYTALNINADHRQMAVFGSPDETGFKRLLGELKRWQRRHTAPPSVNLTPAKKFHIDEAYFNVNRAKSGRTPLVWAAQAGIEPVVKLLLDTGKVDVDMRDVQDDRTALSWAAGAGHEVVVKLLLETEKVDVNSRDCKTQRTPLMWATVGRHESIARLLIESGKAEVDLKDYPQCRTPLSWAAGSGLVDAVKLLLETGKVDLNATDAEFHRSPLLWAVWGPRHNKHTAIVRMLLATDQVDVNVRDRPVGRTALSWAAGAGNLETVRMIVETGKADFNSQDSCHGRTPLIWAAYERFEDVMKAIINGAEMDINIKDSASGRSALSWAAGGGLMDGVKTLLDTGKVDVNSKDYHKRTPLYWASKGGQQEGPQEVVRILEQAGAQR